MCAVSPFRVPIAASPRRSSPSRAAAVGYTPGSPILSRLDLRIDADDRIALLGSNGNGKSTFAKFIAGRLEAEDGLIRWRRNSRPAFLPSISWMI
jgi:ATPase subunit of ABC transporter with duplicated ATPase domains